jgi:hypothetical protein
LFKDCTFILNNLVGDHSVKIGDGSDFSKPKVGDHNIFSGNTAIGNSNRVNDPTANNWFANHPLITSIVGGLIIALIIASWWWDPLMKMLGIVE